MKPAWIEVDSGVCFQAMLPIGRPPPCISNIRMYCDIEPVTILSNYLALGQILGMTPDQSAHEHCSMIKLASLGSGLRGCKAESRTD